MFATHFNAHYDSETPLQSLPTYAFHESELNDLQGVMQCLETEDVLDYDHHHMFLMGDLNIDGDHINGLINDLSRPRPDNLGQYYDLLAPGGRSILRIFRDVWLRESPTQANPISAPNGGDPGATGGLPATGGDDAQRLDYIFHYEPTTIDIPLCNQHATLAYNLRDYD